MSYNFDDFLEKGNAAAKNVIKNRKEINEVLENLETSLAKFLTMGIEFNERDEYVSNNSDPVRMIVNSFIPREKTGFTVIYIKSTEVDVEKAIFKLKRSDNVYPITIEREKHRLVSDEQSEFADAVGQIASDPQLHLQLNSFKSNVTNKLEEQKLLVPKAE
jgi:hypothetical protein